MKRAAALLAALALVLAACSGSDTDGVATLDDGTTSTTIADEDAGAVSASEEEALLAFSACMRENGVEDFEDPTINADGSIEFGAQAQGEGEGIPDEAELEQLDAAFSACSSNLEGVSFGGGESFDITEFEDAFVEFSACMRDKGFDIDDPDFSAVDGPGGFINLFGDLDITDPATMEALDECQEAFAGFGPGGSG